MRHNIAILGLPRSGKTTKAIELFDAFPSTAIFINTQWERYFDARADVIRMSDFKKWHPEIKRAVISPHVRGDLIPFIEHLFKIQQSSKREIIPIRIIIDEVFHYQESPEAKYALKRLVVDGLRWNIQTIITAHMPQMVDSQIYKNIHLYYFFELNNALYDYFKRVWRIDLFPYAQYLAQTGKYNYVLYDMRKFYKKEEGKRCEQKEQQ